MPLVSIIIPSFNLWDFTKNCLDSIARHTNLDAIEVIVVDNGSTDKTAELCEAYGLDLFGEKFSFLAQGVNKNFAPACNIGARHAKGSFLFFLNNDTQLTNSWLEPLLDAMEKDPMLGAVGPVLLYPNTGLLTDLVQHLGIAISPYKKVLHLYRNFPLSHPVVKKRRKLQAITAAAFLIRKDLFDEVGAFDESFVNGFEDVELCIRITRKKGYYFSCISESIAYHYESQTPGRHDKIDNNLKEAECKIAPYIEIDQGLLAEEDGFVLRLEPWLAPYIALPPDLETQLDTMLRSEIDISSVLILLKKYPLWRKGYYWLAQKSAMQKDYINAFFLISVIFYMIPEPENFLWFYRYYKLLGKNIHTNIESCISDYALPLECYKNKAQRLLANKELMGIQALADDLHKWLNSVDVFREKELVPFFKKLRNEGIASLDPCKNSISYSYWIELEEAALESSTEEIQRDIESRQYDEKITICIFTMNRSDAHLEKTLRSLQAQRYRQFRVIVPDFLKRACEGILHTQAESPSLISADKHSLRIEYYDGKKTFYDLLQESMSYSAYFIPLVCGSILAKNALYYIAKTFFHSQNLLCIYSNEDTMYENLLRGDPIFKEKQAFSPKHLLGLSAYNIQKIFANKSSEEIQKKLVSPQALAFFCSASCKQEQIGFLPQILYHKLYIS